MIGIVIATHGQLGDAFIHTAEFVLRGPIKAVASVSVNGFPDKLHNKIKKTIKRVNHGHGILILTDMFGGTASDISYSFLDAGHVEIISAVNLPILLKAVDYRKRMDLFKLSKCLQAYGKRSISVGSELLQGYHRTPLSICPFRKEEACLKRSA